MVILITGASSGIGLEAAKELAAKGNTVYGAARRTELIVAEGVTPLRLDLTDDQSIQDTVKTVIDAEGRIDILVNNAGYGSYGPVECVPIDEARRQLEVNLFGMARLTQLILPYMRKQGSGRIINVSSIAGRISTYMGAWYHCSKYSVEAFSDALRCEVAPFGIKVVIIEPGPIRTDWAFIAADHLEKCTSGTPYEEAAVKEADLFRKYFSSHLASGPSVVAHSIIKAATAHRPRLRYVTGRGSSTIVAIHAILPSRWYDSLFRRVMRIKL